MASNSRTSIAVPGFALLTLFALSISAILAIRSVTTNNTPVISSLPIQLSAAPNRVSWNRITANEESPAKEFFKTYPVADLITPVKLKRNFQYDGIDWLPDEKEDLGSILIDFDPLIALITTTIKPDSWKKNGNCQIKRLEENLSLVVKQDQAAHDQVAFILNQLRVLQGVTLSGRGFIVVLNPDADERNLSISFDKTPLTLSRINSDILQGYATAKSLELLDFPVVESSNGQNCRLKLSGFADIEKADIEIRQVADSDRTSVGLSLTIRKPECEPEKYQVKTQSGQFTAFDVSHLLEEQDHKRAIFCFRTDIIDLTGK